MTTTTEKILAKAAEYEEKARALRLAAAELNGHLTERAVDTLPARLAKAFELRETQRPGRKKGVPAAERHAILAALDTSRTYQSREMVVACRALGYPGSQASRSTDLHALGWNTRGPNESPNQVWFHADNKTAPKTRKPKSKSHSNATITAQRRATAKLLKRIETHNGPVAAGFFRKSKTPASTLMRHGYVTRAEDGTFTRTDNIFEV